MKLKFKCPMTNLVVEVSHESELPEGQVFERVATPAPQGGTPQTPHQQPMAPSRIKKVYQPYISLASSCRARLYGRYQHAA